MSVRTLLNVWDNMGPSIVDTVEDLKDVQQSLWEVSPVVINCFMLHHSLMAFTDKCQECVVTLLLT